MRRFRQLLAWIALLVILGLLIATIVTGVQGSTLTFSFLGATMGVSIVVWVLLWFTGLLQKRGEGAAEQSERNPEKPEPGAELTAKQGEKKESVKN